MKFGLQNQGKGFEPVSLPTGKPAGRGGGVRNRGVAAGRGGYHQQQLLQPNGRGRGGHHRQHGRRRDNGGSGPPLPIGAQPVAAVNQYNIQDMLWQLFQAGFKDNYLPLTSDLDAAITQTIDLGGKKNADFKSHMQSTFLVMAAVLDGHLTQPAQQVFEQLISGHFDPLNVNQVITLAELTGQNLLIFLASTPGLHGYKYYRRGSLEVISGELSKSLPEFDRNTLILAYSPRPLGFKRIGLPDHQADKVLPVGPNPNIS